MPSDYQPAVVYLQKLLAERPRPTVGVICGSGLSHLSDAVDQDSKLVVPYSDIPGFPQVGVAGHQGEMVFGSVHGGAQVAILRGRHHSYEGHDMQTVVLAVRVFAKLGIKTLIVTNAAGGIRASFQTGDLMVISDHIGLPLLAGKGPLVGPNDESLGPRFPAMSDAYDVRLRHIAARAARDLGMGFVHPSGTYFFVSGPGYETAAESGMIRALGGDAVGMSTVPEVQAARHAGMSVLGLSLISNKVVLPGDASSPPASHAEVLATTQARQTDVQRLVETILARIAGPDPGPTALPGPDVAASDVRGATATTTGAAAVTARLGALDLARVTPMQAIGILDELKAMLL
jgi:purine-nucleoside phosphorylase